MKETDSRAMPIKFCNEGIPMTAMLSSRNDELIIDTKEAVGYVHLMTYHGIRMLNRSQG